MIAIVIPTINEKENIGRLILDIFKLPIKIDRILIVDDNSTDGTIELVRQLSQKYPQIKLIIRKTERGLGRAYLEGFRNVTQENYEYIVQMDADGSHDPKVVPAMIKLADLGNDLVIGSRYIKGGKIEKWNWLRRMISRFGNYYARFILGLPYQDLTGGYKCWRGSLLSKIIDKPLNAVGYLFQVETTYRAHLLEGRIAEIPIIFRERDTGTSKFSIKILIEAYWGIIKLRFSKK